MTDARARATTSELSIDISLQAVAEQALEKVILDLRENGVGQNKEGKDARGRRGCRAACVRPVRSSPCASYPTYDISRPSIEDYESPQRRRV
ncbi:MAG: hypothetical protein ACLU3I_00535 [Acutalibacteraceae bacterium]